MDIMYIYIIYRYIIVHGGLLNVKTGRLGQVKSSS